MSQAEMSRREEEADYMNWDHNLEEWVNTTQHRIDTLFGKLVLCSEKIKNSVLDRSFTDAVVLCWLMFSKVRPQNWGGYKISSDVTFHVELSSLRHSGDFKSYWALGNKLSHCLVT